MNVLVVDDNPEIREAIQAALGLNGHEVETAEDGLDALEKVAARRPDLILLDLNMPRLDDFGLATELGRRGLRPLVPLIVITARGSAPDNADRIGAEGYLEKPFSIRTLLQKVAELTAP